LNNLIRIVPSCINFLFNTILIPIFGEHRISRVIASLGYPLPVTLQGGKLVRTEPSDTITGGSTSVLINGEAVARISDEATHGGKTVVGNPTELIG